ncbi:aminotransferase class I/II-fold pyridoxal phosphate-dependent enzyme [Nonomuraea sp. NPDC049269]|uniref:aminotransferase class I/II-fold pyridoxal phosphate-dependent enzyme n=1 Tax=Nonomuraea sp. NPDC049269 TaxID=3364349 RepID=UPI003717F242
MVNTSPPYQRFELENWQSDYEQTVRFNLSDSTIDPVSLAELLGPEADLGALLATELYYPEVNGERELRELIAAGYPGGDLTADNVLVTVGASEANAAIVDAYCPPGSRVIVMEPGYQQVWGLARNRGCDVRAFRLDPERGWRPDLRALSDLAVPGTSVIYVCNPNNPVGYILDEDEMTAIVEIAERCGAWLVADEVYHGSEHDPAAPARTFVGRYDRVIGVNSMSKSYGLSGLRVGWAAGPPDVIRKLWRRHEYAAIATGRLDNVLAALALQTDTAARILGRNRAAMGEGWALFEDWKRSLGGLVTAHRPMATPLAFVRFATALDSVEVGHRLRVDASTLICPGVYFGCEGYLRMNVGFGLDYVAQALEAMTPVVRAMAEQDPAHD